MGKNSSSAVTDAPVQLSTNAGQVSEETMERKGEVVHFSDTSDTVTDSHVNLDVFFTYLAKTANVEAALAEGGLTAEAALAERINNPEFALRWQQALAASYDELEMELLYRARFGTEKPIYYGGKNVGSTREYDNGVALRLLRQHRKDHAARESGIGPEENAVDVLRDRLLAYRKKNMSEGPTTASRQNADTG